MKKITSFAAAGLLALAATPVYAVNMDETTLEKDGVKIQYWNDFKNDVSSTDLNMIYPNMRVNVNGNDNFGVGTIGTINYVYKYVDGGAVIKDGALNGTIGNDGTFHTYINLGVLENGNIEVDLTLTLIPSGSTVPTIIVYDPYIFTYTKVEINPDDPAAELTWNVANGEETSDFNYTVTTDNVPEGATYRVWLDAPGNVNMGESTDKEGTITINVPKGGNVTYWVKCEVTLPDGTVLKAKGNDTGVDFKSTYVYNFTLICEDALADSSTSGKLNYQVSATPEEDMEDIQNFKILVVTNAFGDDVEVGRIENVTEASGTIQLTGLKENSVNNLWAKMEVTLKNGVKLPIIQYPGAAQGWSGLSIDTSSVSVTEIVTSDAEVEYFNLQGVKVANPSNGLYIRVQGNKASKVLVK